MTDKLTDRLFGVGVNDANYVIHQKVNGKRVICPFYSVWSHMLERCYSKKYQERKPTYIGCSMCKDWLIFSNFKKWMEKQNWEGMQMDKDILIAGNKEYGPDTCIFVSREINLLLTDSAATRGKYPQGVSLNKRNNKFVAQIRKYGKRHHIGCFNSQEEAGVAYWNEKITHIVEVALQQGYQLRTALLRIAAYKRLKMEGVP